MKIIGEEKDIKHFKDVIDYEDSQIYLDPSNKKNTYELWVEEENSKEKDEEDKKEDKKEEEKENNEKEKRKVKFFVVKNTYEYPHEVDNRSFQKKNEGGKKKKEKKIVDDDDELTEEEAKRLEETTNVSDNWPDSVR